MVLHQQALSLVSFIRDCLALGLLKGSADGDPADLSMEASKRRMERKFQDNAAKPLFSGTAVRDSLCLRQNMS